MRLCGCSYLRPLRQYYGNRTHSIPLECVSRGVVTTTLLKLRYEVVVVIDSCVQPIGLAKTEETTLTQRDSHIYLSNVNPSRGHKEVRRPTGHIMAITRYANQQRSRSRRNRYQVQPPDSIGNLSASTRCLWVRTIHFLLSGMLPVFQNLSDVLPTRQTES